ncbi:hypothetical protein [Flavonifractor plautii]|uniref:hypothetical protein n=1 Tax=Flavonifractor plautii TaxID=292800 RepID=UPI0018ABD8B3|nr:hypothetical protein [Flavonifractor plautii]
MICDYSPYTLPTIDFVGGETQDLLFNVYFYKNNQPFSLSGCTSNFSVVSFTNKTGVPILSKQMTSIFNDAGTSDNVLTVTLQPSETVDLCGKYIYQIIIKDINGDAEIPKQGILYITNNINKSFI